jgi:diguanylate cyclase (GGDEF)-like protein
VTAIAVPFQTALFGRRVFSVGYGIDGGELKAFVAHTSTTPSHRVMLIDADGDILAASPRVHGGTLGAADGPLARAMARGSFGKVPGASQPSMFVSAPVPGTPWKIAIEVPERELFASIGGAARVTPWMIFAFVTLLGLLLLALFARSLRDRARLAALSLELEGIARTDPLTGLLNRRGFDEHATPAFARARRRREPVSILMIDLDRFKEVNDQHGHEAGDRVLGALADCLREALRAEDIVARLGGDEFVVAMFDTDERAARTAAERVLARTATVDLRDLGLEQGIPMSVGRASGVHVSPETLIREADLELYRVKDAGRNDQAVPLS